jgi:large repetitive protein
LTYSASLENGEELPDWLSFDAAARKLSGIPGAGDKGIIKVKIKAEDSSGGTANVSDLLTPSGKCISKLAY